MTPEATAKPRFVAWARLLIAFVVAFDVTAFWQWMGGAFQSEFGGHPDEGAHYVAGLGYRGLIVDFQNERQTAPGASRSDAGGKIVERILADPRSASATVWPSVFSVVQMGWAFVFGTSRLSVLLLVAALAAGVATLLYGAVREEFGEWAAVAAALIWLCATVVRESYGMFMPEMLGALAMFGAARAWGRFLDVGRKRDALSFGILASVALWTEGAGLAVVLMAGISLLWSRHWQRLAKWELWLFSALPVLSMLYVRKRDFERFDFSAHSLAQAASFNGGQLASAAGLAVFVFAVVGVCFRCFSRGERQGRWVAMASLVVSVFAYDCARSGRMEARHVVAAVPGLIMLAVAGVRSTAGLMSARIPQAGKPRQREWLWFLLLVLLVLPLEILKHRRKDFAGFGPITRMLIAEAPHDARILISSDRTGEGMFISELVMKERRTGFTIETAGMSLVAHGDRRADPRTWRERFADDRELLDYLTKGRIQYVILDDAVPFEQRADYHDQIRRVLEDNVRSFWPVYESTIIRGGEVLGRPAKVYRVMAGG